MNGVVDVRGAVEQIGGVRAVDLKGMTDVRGSFTELFRAEWFPERNWRDMQCNRSESRKGVLRGLHFHLRQVDYWHCIEGHVRVGLYDLRQSSETRGGGLSFDLSADDPVGLFIPEGVAHGYLALTDATIFYVVNRYYDAADEFGVMWNDPDLGLSWEAGDTDGIDPAKLIVSERDASNPRLAEVELPD